MVRLIFESIAWIVVGLSLLFSTAHLIVACNLFSWNPRLNIETILLTMAVCISLILTFFIARKTEHISTVVVSLIVCIVLFVFGIIGFIDLYGEEYSSFLRSELSPEWFRISILIILFLPMLSWIYYPFRYIRKSKKNHF
ncbi:MAG: hypothetical protein GY714_18700 [Desulfobacterales bacterium]|nr:hypothetical protein [Desulfobacterales bacterium]MCP4163471.1 hypothetical protein [Deltaproteobacteria bacterium]